MRISRLRTFVLWTVAVLAICIATTTPAQADNTIAWLTGSNFSSLSDNAIFAESPDGVLAAQISYLPTVGDLTWTYYGDCSIECYGNGVGLVTGGSANGILYYFSDPNNTPIATFTGSVTSGTVDFQVWIDNVGCCSDYENMYWYDSKGTWSNGWWTSGSVFAIQSEGFSTNVSMTTYTPEPGSMVLFGSGIIGLAGVLRRKLMP